MAENLNLKLLKISTRTGYLHIPVRAENLKQLKEKVFEKLQINAEKFVFVNDYEGIAERGDSLNEDIFQKLLNNKNNSETHLVALEKVENISENNLRYFEIPNYHELADLIEKLNRAEEIDLCFLVDCTPCMEIQKCMSELQTIIDKIHTTLAYQFPEMQLRKAFIGYRDIEDKDKEFEIFETDFDEFKQFIKNVLPGGKGDDTCEDVLGGLNKVAQLNWKSQTRLLIHVCDAPGHGKLFHGTGIDDNYPDVDPQGLESINILRKLFSELDITYYFFKINNTTDEMINKFNEILDNMNLKRIIEFQLPSNEELLEFFNSSVLSSITSTIFEIQQQTMHEVANQAPKVPKNLSLNKSNLFWAKDDEFNEYSTAKCITFSFTGTLDAFEKLRKNYDENRSGTKQAEKRKKKSIFDEIERDEKIIKIKIRKSPFAKGNLRYAYAAIVNETTRRVVKNSLYENDEADANKFNEALISTQVVARYLAEQFRKKMKEVRLHGNKRLSFNKVKLIYIEETKEYYTIEKYIGDHFYKWNSSIGYVNEDIYSNTLDAYSHWTYVATNNYLVVSDLQGFRLFDNEKQQEKYILTDPAISCVDRQFTSTDLDKKRDQSNEEEKRSTDIRDDFLGGNDDYGSTSSDEF